MKQPHHAQVLCFVRLFVCAAILLGAARSASAQNAVDPFNPGASSDVTHVALQSDGKVLVGGTFTMLGGGGAGTTTRNHIGRLFPDGSLDTSFNPGANNSISAIAVQPDGNILVGGAFTAFGGGCAPTCSTTVRGIMRVDSTGAVDPLFTNPGINGAVTGLALQANGQIVISGSFTGLGGCAPICSAPRSHIARLNSDGSIDQSFNPGMNGTASVLLAQADGTILVGGGFTTIGGGSTGTTPRRNIARLYFDGSVDAGFDPGSNGAIDALCVQADGRILVGGLFTMLGGGGTGTTVRNNIGRLNANGSLDNAFDPGANDGVESIVVQANGKITVVGGFTTLGGGGTGTTTRYGIGKLFPDGSLDLSVDPGSASGTGNGNGLVWSALVQPDQKILVVGSFLSLGGRTGTSPRNRIGRLLADGSPEPEFNPGADGTVQTFALQPDGKIVVGGLFGKLGGVLGTTLRHDIGRLNPDGSVDPFDPGANGLVAALAVQPDGAILVGGQFTLIGGGGSGHTGRSNIARLDSTGAVDATFNPGANGIVHDIIPLADGKILVAGDFTLIGGGGTGSMSRPYLARLNADGSVDMAFDAAVASGFVHGLAVQADGKIVLGGNFTAIHGVTRFFIGRVNADGSLDAGFNPGTSGSPFADVTSLVVQPDGAILVGGDFNSIGGGDGTGTQRNRIARLLSTGAVDTSFDPGAGANAIVNSLALQTDGKIIVGGAFSALHDVAQTRARVGRLNTDGSLDATFNPGANAAVDALALLPTGTLLVGGDFSALGGGGTGSAGHFRIGEVANTGPATQSLTSANGGTTITWLRGGTSPEVWRTTFESSTAPTTRAPSTYTFLGAGTRISGGWQLTGQNLPTNQPIYVRARGFYGEGNYDGSGAIAETVHNVNTSVPFTDDPVTPGVTPIKAVHIIELRNRINTLRVLHGFSPFAWTDDPLTNTTVVKALHIIELRIALSAVYVALGLAQPSYTDSPLGAGAIVKAIDISELRSYVVAVE